MPKQHPEHDMQVEFFNWVRLNLEYSRNKELKKALGLCYGVPNGSALKKVKSKKKEYNAKTGKWKYKYWSPEGKRMKDEGMTAGMPDVNLDWPVLEYIGDDFDDYTRYYASLRIEHKYRAKISPKIQALIDTGNYIVDLSAKQKDKRKLLIEAGHRVVVSYAVKQSVNAVFEYLPFEKKDYQGIREYLG